MIVSAGFSKFTAVIFFFAVFIAGPGWIMHSSAQQLRRIEITSPPVPVGSGARALGMGGAFVSLADDATSASWNPGGLVQLEFPEISFVGALFSRNETAEFGDYPETSESHTIRDGSVNYLSAVYPFSVRGRNMAVAVNYSDLYDFSRKWDFNLTIRDSDSLSGAQEIQYDQSGGLSTVGIAYGVELSRSFSIGAALNIWENGLTKNEWEKRSVQRGEMLHRGHLYRYDCRGRDGYELRSGVNVNLGVLWKVYSDRIAVGAFFRSPFRADVRHESNTDTDVYNQEFPNGKLKETDSYGEDLKLDMPMSYGIGVSWRFSDALTVSLDLSRTKWDDFVFIDSKGFKTSSVSGKAMEESDVGPTHHARLGMEYLVDVYGRAIPVCAGVFYDPAPSEGNPDDYFGFSAGSGFVYGRLEFDFAYQYRWANNAGSYMFPGPGFSQDISEHILYFSVICKFGRRVTNSF